ncbi:MAG: Ig-like domain-containing protein, partial [Armatimonadota bacterium]
HATQVMEFTHGEGAASVLNGVTVEQGSSGSPGGGIACLGSSPTITNCYVRGNWSNSGGGVYVENGSPLIEGNEFDSNGADDGAGLYLKNASPVVRGNTFHDNYTDVANSGGAIFCTDNSAPTISNNLFYLNHAGVNGGAVCCLNSPAVLVNNTFDRNNCNSGGGTVYFQGPALPSLRNCIVSGATTGGGIAAPVSTVTAIWYCDVYGNTDGNYVGTSNPTGTHGNISVDPLFASAAEGNFRLKSQGGRWTGAAWSNDLVSSPCLDTGDPASAFALEPAPNGGRVNMGYDGNTAHASKSTPVAPAVTATTPTGTTASAELPTLTATFSTTMNTTTAQNAFSISPAQGAGVAHGWPGTFSWVGNKLVYKLSTSLAKTRTYTVTIAKTAKSSAGVAMAVDKTWTFKTNAQPAVTSYAPTGTAVPRSTDGKVIKIVFNQPMNHASAQGALWVYKKSATPSATPTRPAGAFSWVGNEMRYTFSAKLAMLTNYVVRLGTGAKSSTGVARSNEFTWTFKTGNSVSSPSTITVASAPTAVGAQIMLNLSAAANVTVSIRNLAGREIATLTPGRLEAGVHSLLWNGKSRTGTQVPDGTYLLQVSANTTDGACAQAITALQLR